MRLCAINPRVYLINGRIIALFRATFICLFILMPCTRLCFGSNGSVNVNIGQSGAESNIVTEDSNGPTLIMSYRKENFVKNPLTSFMYFVPLISPTFVDNVSSANNKQQVGIISHKMILDSESFQVFCEFEILGSGFNMNTFESAGMIAAHTDGLKKGETLTNMLDYIKFDGDGFGVLEVKGKLSGAVETVTEVSMQFNAKGHKSPVTIGLYDVKPIDGKYKYENRSNQVVARVNTLIFKKTEQTPRMGIKVASISDAKGSEGFISGIKGAIANFFITPPKVTELGNETLLNFGYALLKQKSSFTFPKAKNIKENKIVDIDSIQK
jgi:hypothetical protein